MAETQLYYDTDQWHWDLLMYQETFADLSLYRGVVLPQYSIQALA